MQPSTPARLSDLNIKIFADGAEKASMLELAANPLIKGFTTNPTLMRKAGITDYEAFAKDILTEITDRPVSFEVFSDSFDEMYRQAKLIASWGSNVYVKIPITNTLKEPSYPLIERLAREGVKLNVTAIFSLEQVRNTINALHPDVPAVISVFAGRIADTGIDPVPLMKEAKTMLAMYPNFELLWASPRELLNIYHAEEAGADIITVTPDVLKKTANIGLDLEEFSLQTVQMFYDDGQKAGYVMYNDYIHSYLDETREIASKIDRDQISKMISILEQVRADKGRLFILGVGGGAGHASHAVNDFRKLASMEAYTPADNVSELTARANDDGLHTVFSNWLLGSNLRPEDAILVFSVGGGNAEKNVSANIVEALWYAKNVGAKVLGIVGRDGGYTAQVADACVIVPVVNPSSVTPHTEGFQAVVWHLIVSHPKFQSQKGKWESIQK
jgi:transaldolase